MTKAKAMGAKAKESVGRAANQVTWQRIAGKEAAIKQIFSVGCVLAGVTQARSAGTKARAMVEILVAAKVKAKAKAQARVMVGSLVAARAKAKAKARKALAAWRKAKEKATKSRTSGKEMLRRRKIGHGTSGILMLKTGCPRPLLATTTTAA